MEKFMKEKAPKIWQKGHRYGELTFQHAILNFLFKFCTFSFNWKFISDISNLSFRVLLHI